jgi:hypothetical protein
MTGDLWTGRVWIAGHSDEHTSYFMEEWNGEARITTNQPFSSWIHLEFEILQKIYPNDRESDGRLQEALAELAAAHLDAQLGVTPARD